MRRTASGLFGELISIDLKENKSVKDEIADEKSKCDSKESSEEDSPESTKLSDENSMDALIQGNPSYPRIFWGESAKPLTNGMFPETEYIDDNIHTTYHGLISFLG